MGDSLNPPSSSNPPSRERRSVARYMLIASVEIIEPTSDVHISGRVSEISRKGCYIDLLSPLPAGTLINLRITRDRGSFVTPGKIIYAQEGIGMGVVYMNSPADQMKILDSWLAEFSQ
jgi:hypothetical protein